MAEQTLHDMIADACLRGAAEAEITGDLEAYLDSHGIEGEHKEAMLAAPQRLTVYRRLVRNTLEGVTFQLLSRTRARLNAAAEGAFDETFARFLESAPPKTHYLKDVPREFFAWAEPRWKDRSDVPAYVADLGRYELSHFEIGAMPRLAEPQELQDLALDRPLAFSSVTRMLRTTSAVHRLDEQTAEPEAGEFFLLLYRDEAHSVRVLELGPLAYAALEQMMEGAALGEALAKASAATGIAMGDDLLAQMAVLLADLGERGVLLGAR